MNMKLFFLLLTIFVNHGAHGLSTLEFSCAPIGNESSLVYQYKPTARGVQIGQLAFVINWGDGNTTTLEESIDRGETHIETHTYMGVGELLKNAGEVLVEAEYNITEQDGSVITTTYSGMYTIAADECYKGWDSITSVALMTGVHLAVVTFGAVLGAMLA